MIKSVFKVLSVVMALCLFIGIVPITAFAENDSEFFYYSEKVDTIEFSPQAEVPFNSTISSNKYFSSGAAIDTTKFFYNQLTTTQKSLYDQLWAAHINSYSDCTVAEAIEDGETVLKITVPISMTGITITGTGTSSTAKNNALSNAQQQIIIAMTALTQDNPLYFGTNGVGFSYAGSQKYSSGQYTYTVSGLNVILYVALSHYSSVEEITTKRDAAIAKMETIKVNGISRHEKVKSIHDYLTKNLVYDQSISLPNIYDVYGAFVNELCVCEGYAEAFKMLCDREGIPCITVIGTGNGGAHKWNMVLMEDGEWYTLDATWDDQTESDNAVTFYEYFLIGSNTKTWFHPDYADSQIHIGDCRLFSIMNTALSYPTLSTDTYGVGLLTFDAGDVHFDKTRGVIMVGKDLAYNYYADIFNSASYGAPTSYSRTVSGSGTTTSTVTVSDGVTSKTYLVAMRGDINASNTVTADDYNLVVSTATTKSKVTENTAKFYAGDMTQDGTIDGFDAIAHDLYTSGTLVFD